MSQEVPGEPILDALRHLVELERDEPIENDANIKFCCDVVAYYMEGAEWEDDEIENFIKGIQNQDVQRRLRERLEYIPVESYEEDTDDEVLSAEEEYDTQMGDADEEKSESSDDESSEDTDDTITYALEGGEEAEQLDNPPLRV